MYFLKEAVVYICEECEFERLKKCSNDYNIIFGGVRFIRECYIEINKSYKLFVYDSCFFL